MERIWSGLVQQSRVSSQRLEWCYPLQRERDPKLLLHSHNQFKWNVCTRELTVLSHAQRRILSVSAVLHFSSRSCAGKTNVPLHVEQICSGLWSGVCLRVIRSRKLQCTLTLLHFLGAGVSFVCVSFYAVLLTELTRKCDLTGHEKVLYPLRFISTVIQIFATIFYAFFYIQNNSFYNQLSAVFEWMLTMNMELFELSYIVEFSFFSSFMLSNLLSRREEEKPLMMT
ncbi:uncharacterized protein si:dkey-228d14.5 isoform X2 [Nothobranchius furzeri]|uniref:Transcript variant X2 n=1 Tax=Nothobranchius furzeri TaxID=105023 RepID=A0A9D3BRM2_NOTFU|nr:transcript variant X2 [Nothobranchius furzeri]